MAIEYVDATQLDSDLTSVADAIRAKSGGSSQLAFPSDFISEIQAIPTGGGQGLLDLTIDYTNSNSRTWTGTIENNAVKNFYMSAGYMQVPLVLKQPIAITTNDVITMTLSNVSRPNNMFVDFGMFSVCIENTSYGSKIPIASNFSLPNGETSKSLTYTGNPIIIWAFGFGNRTSVTNVTYADVHIDINGIRLF